MNIWKDPKVELPNDMSFVLFLYCDNEVMRGTYHDIVYIGDNDFRESVFVEKDTKEPLDYEDYIKAWCYEEDLIKQAGDE